MLRGLTAAGRARPSSAHRQHGLRGDIQGLRAIAILSVIAYHAGLNVTPGGYVGVDIFFVISGYLICGMLQREVAATGSIAVGRFWMRRMRRLLPNACLTLAAILTLSAATQSSLTHPLVAGSVMAATLYFANLHFAARDLDYFADTEAPDPVMHFWSLSVEEQFYIVWPLLLAAFARLARSNPLRLVMWLTAGVWVVSLSASLIAVHISQPLAFYHGEMRAWQLATGGLVALIEPACRALPGRLRDVIAWLGMAGMSASILLFTDGLLYPGGWALLPTLSAAAVVVGARPEACWLSPSRALAVAPLQWVGDRSYSLYLWHWPALAYAPLLMPSSPWATPVALLAGGAVAIATYEWVETPIRTGNLPAFLSERSRWVGLTAAGAAIAAVLILCGVLIHPAWYENRAALALSTHLKKVVADRGRNIKEHCNRTFEQTDQPLCAYGDVTAKRTAVLFGDSHAAQWFTPLDKVARENGWRLLAWTKSACPAAEISIWHRRLHKAFTECDVWRENVLERLTGGERPDLVLIASFTESASAVLDASTGRMLGQSDGEAAWRTGFAATIGRLQAAGIRTVVIADTPRADPRYLDCLAAGGGRRCDRRRSLAIPAVRPDLLAAADVDTQVLNLDDRICRGSTCPVVLDGRVVYRDRHHVTASFSATLADAFAPYLPASDDDLVVSSISSLRRE